MTTIHCHPAPGRGIHDADGRRRVDRAAVLGYIPVSHLIPSKGARMTVIGSSRPLILGSASPWRRKELEAIGLPFIVMTADIDEKAIRHPDPAVLTWHIAAAKAAALLGRIAEPSLLITCDQVAVFGGEIREKPCCAEQARRWLAEYGDGEEPVSTVTTVVVTDTATRRSCHATDVAKAWFEPLPAKAVELALA